MAATALAVALFTAVVMTAVVAIAIARQWLAPTGPTELVVNDSRTVTAATGSKLLEALADADVLLPSPCGGRGTCGQCRVRIDAGGAPPLPSDTARIARRDLAQGVRLACQTVVRGAMRIHVPDDVLGVRRFDCSVRRAANVATWIREIALDVADGAAFDFTAGSYVQIEVPPFRARFRDFDIGDEYAAEWSEAIRDLEAGTDNPTTRAYSLANAPHEPGMLLNVRIALPPAGGDAPPGVGSSYLFGLRPGDTVAVRGPYGSMHARDSGREMVLVGGGAGMAPLRSIVLDQIVGQGANRTISFWYGARNLRELFYADLFAELAAAHANFDWTVALSAPRPGTPWDGPVGFVHDVLFERYLKDHPAPETVEYYLCGPPLMVTAVTGMLDSLGVPPENVAFDDFGG